VDLRKGDSGFRGVFCTIDRERFRPEATSGSKSLPQSGNRYTGHMRRLGNPGLKQFQLH
jgi:hypothetical protein